MKNVSSLPEKCNGVSYASRLCPPDLRPRTAAFEMVLRQFGWLRVPPMLLSCPASPRHGSATRCPTGIVQLQFFSGQCGNTLCISPRDLIRERAAFNAKNNHVMRFADRVHAEVGRDLVCDGLVLPLAWSSPIVGCDSWKRGDDLKR